ncbi:multicomponent Na+:H+ antiporter subunit G [Lipingzhangella halophila]|uniref:Multicomponent Na+:H+ antiporter subunit G n=1 Tax=Lipingzhangella halophila TaxID=1783352 RepID=A0A7W7RCH1_9ACTN|nr:monovalent cation/H(+) antiporter subunit G [Lipingzhangella halophila]MBB4929452.1 multicomponent Na+:H+ antiporter subunit G [Lipingzhangella halophila]
MWGIAGGVLIAIGVALTLLAGIGLLRLPDAYNRMNAVSKAASLGVACTLVGTVLLMPDVAAAVKTVVAIALQFITAAVGSYALARAAYRTGVPLAQVTRFDELSERSRRGG